jgi:type 2 lantibiotic biosynthesis protein LanM
VDAERVWRIVERAATLTERLSGAYAPVSAEPDALAEARWRSWCERVAHGDAARLEKRLRWDGLDPGEAKRALGALRTGPDRALPDWSGVLLEVLAEAAADHGAPDRVCDPAAPVAFEDVLAPFVRVARRRVRATLAPRGGPLRAAAWVDLERSLLAGLSRVAAPVLFAEFAARRSLAGGWAGAFVPAGAAPSRELYARFAAELLGGGLLPLFERYSLLARLLCTRLTFWADRAVELSERLRADLPELGARFAPDGPPGRVARIQAGLSDSHRGWSTVSILEFESGARVVYKPRPLSLEQTFSDLLEWLNGQGAEPALQALRVLPRPGYGWMEFAAPAPCADGAAVARYYERAGMLLCLVRLLGGGDFHHENVIARGEHPVLVDQEVLLSSRLLGEEERAGGVPQVVEELLSGSVLGTMLLPVEQVGQEGLTHAMGGLTGFDTERRVQHSFWRDPNTDQMALVREDRLASSTANLPHLDGVAARAEDHLDSLQRGFRGMYRLLLRRRDMIAAPAGPLAPFAEERVRVIVRPTNVYGRALHRASHPRFLQTGVDMGIELDVLNRETVARHEERPALWAAFRREREDLEMLDVPLFCAHTGDTQLRTHDGEALFSYCADSPYSGTLARLRSLGRADRVAQERFISLSFRAVGLLETVRRGEAPAGPALGADEAVEEAASIARALAGLAHPSRRGPRWYGIVERDAPARARLIDAGDALYLGSSGVALLSAALHATTGEAEHRDAAHASLRRLLDRLSTPSRRAALAARTGAWGIGGIGGMVYSLALCAELLGSPELLRAARAAAGLLVPDAARDDPALHVVSGSAGAVLALLALYRADGDRELLARAAAWGDGLVRACRVEPVSGMRAWRAAGEFRPGFGKGAAGICHALLELHRETGHPAHLDAALEGWAFVRSLRAAGSDSWRIAPGEPAGGAGGSALLQTWCMGSSGIGLAGVAALDTPAGGECAADVQAALAPRRDPGAIATADNCCCGNAAHVELLLSAARRLGRPELREQAAVVGAAVVRRAKQHGSYSTGYGGVYAPGFLKGLAGIGYQLLRLHHGDRLPSVLLLQSAAPA